ncbi:HET-domain-containing protein [Annulohypoxylon truncatum]|uniref:HET-domain-containing protein n=1 Tax=Annulohypoxylon truncatum TaxID=327061 RepID=UPI0020079534|nr:HET-domain-containing protein [Annulohypoxylon truncatum]KAI1212505.1 HET-domain-containing protein [Annulohypoxylon truncatum]
MILELGYYTLFTVIRKPKSGVPACIYHLYALLDFCFYIVPHVSSMNLNLDIGSNTGDEVTWDIIRGWLDECLEKHTRCNQKNITDYVPSRLVKLNDTTGEPTFCVVEKCQVDPQSPYLTLSHRWGESSQLRLKLTRSTSERLSREQLCRTLPKTFRDASEVARRLKICYLWIDSLCIFQDSAEDWLKESSSMRDVYGNAFLNIAALGAEDNHGGLFFSRNPSELKPTIFNFSVDGPEDPHLYRFDHDTGSASWVGPILQRGWVLQERILSRRVLYFGSRQVFWECYEITCSETHPKNFNQYVYNKYDEKEQGQTRTEPNHHAWKALMGTDRLQPSCEDKLSQLFMDWYEIARTYTTCDLTVSSDKLVALSGIAKDMKRRLTTLGCRDTKYLAGMWSQDLPYALMWSLNEFGRRPESYRAPSWSWAAVDGSSLMPFYGRTDLEALVSVTSARTTLENDEDETGKVRGGMLTLTGFLATANIGLSAENTYEQESNRRRIIDFRNHEDGTRLPKFNDYHYIFCSSACVLFDTKEIYPRVLCLPITRGDRPAKFDLIWGLALVQVGHENYRRVGLFSLHVNPGDSVQSIFTNASQGSVNII